MQYSAVLFADAECPSTYRLGRSAWTARPVSAPQMLRYQAARAKGDMVATVVALYAILRAAFPRRWYYRFYGDPVRMIMALPQDLRERCINELFRVPGSNRSAVIDEDPTEVFRRAQRQLVYGNEQGNVVAPTLAVALMRCRAALGNDWYYNPQQYRTTDGYVPFREVWVMYCGLETEAARLRIEHVAAAQVPQLKNAKRTVEQWLRAAHPADVPTPVS